jgi:hypothetical protein
MGSARAGCRGIITSDWSECLSPSGPFDFMAFHFPGLAGELDRVFRRYTGNEIALGEACRRIEALLPQPVTAEMMDEYLDRRFAVYRGVPELIEWCAGAGVLFMLNTTGMIGYFQRVLAKKLLPPIPVLSANPLLRYPPRGSDPPEIMPLHETRDKPANSAAVIGARGIPPGRVVVVGDSGGDGPHFEWGRRIGAFLVASMPKPSLEAYCAGRGIEIDRRFGPVHGRGEPRRPEEEMQVDLRELIPFLAEAFSAGDRPAGARP